MTDKVISHVQLTAVGLAECGCAIHQGRKVWHEMCVMGIFCQPLQWKVDKFLVRV